MKREWMLKQKLPEGIYQNISYPQALLQVLYNRGITNPKEVTAFLAPDYSEHIHDPFLLPDMEKGVERMLRALDKKEQITVFADYDADAVTAASVMIRGLRELGAKVNYYIPDRFDEGYGMNVDAVKEIIKNGTELIITVDCGITSVEEVAAANELGVDVIITDHHHVPPQLPDALACINQQRTDSEYPFTDLTGVGVAYKFIQALFKTARDQGWPATRSLSEGWEKWLLDFVAIGTVADCQGLLGENRVLVKYGLQVMEKTKWPGLKALISVAGLNSDKGFNSGNIGFQIAPRINAAGRIAHADIALKLFLTDDDLEAGELALQLEKLNRKRQQLTDGILSEAREQLEEQFKKYRILFARAQGWPKGIVGLVAGRLTEEFYRPVLIGSQDDQFTVGSARSIPGFNVVKAFEYAKEHALKYGGHAAAAGFTLENDKVHNFHETLNGYAEINMDSKVLKAKLDIDAQLTNKSEFSYDFAQMLSRLEPFGEANPQPTFLIKDLEVTDVRAVGSEGKHAQVFLRHPVLNGAIIKCIAFSHGYLVKALDIGDKIDMVAELQIDDWNGRKSFQLRLIDWRKQDK